MNKATVKIGGREYTLVASVWTWIEYKRIFNRDWQADRNAQLADLEKVMKFNEEFGGLKDEDFEKLPTEKQELFRRGLRENTVDSEFTFNTLYAMAVAGGFNGTRREMFENVSPSELDSSSELAMVFAELAEEFVPKVKKKD